MKAKKILTILVLALGMVGTTLVSNAAPMGTAFTYQGRLLDKNKPAEGSYDFRFNLYDSNDPCTGTQLGQNDINDVEVIDGHFVVELDFGSDVFDGNAAWLETKVVRSPMGSDPAALRPLMELTPIPYALQTRGIFVGNDGNIGIGTTRPGVKLDVRGETHLNVMPDYRQEGSIRIGRSNGTTRYHLIKAYNDITTANNYLTFSIHDGILDSTNDVLTLKGSGRVGIGTTNPSYVLDVFGNIRATGAIYGSIDNADKVDNYHAGNSSGQVAVSNGNVCVNLNADKLDGYYASDFIKAGMTNNLSDYTLIAGSNASSALLGVSNNSTSEYSKGLYGYGSYGVYGEGTIGVYGISKDEICEGALAYGAYAVYGHALVGGSTKAGYFDGDVTVTGTLTKGGGSFKIDHPVDPENKYLSHSFVESPDMMNVYNGNVVLDKNGEACVQLPEYFEALNRDFRYQLTCIGGFAPVYIAEEISENQFKIAGGKRGMKISWQVTGIREDRYAKSNRIPVEEDKPIEAKGYYLHPELYGYGEEQSIGAELNARVSKTCKVVKKAY
ncbi:MAG: hypothetical protein ACYS0I_14935 [Planctomycetota bacterium]|jgi:hypothetical protein